MKTSRLIDDTAPADCQNKVLCPTSTILDLDNIFSAIVSYSIFVLYLYFLIPAQAHSKDRYDLLYLASHWLLNFHD